MSALRDNPQDFPDDAEAYADDAMVPAGWEHSGGKACLVPTAPTDTTPPALRLLEMLVEEPSTDRQIELVEQAFDEVGDHRAAEALARILARLPGGRRGKELRATLLGTVDGTLADQAKEAGVEPQIFHRSIARLRARLFKKTKNG